MSIADKLNIIAENQEKVYEAGQSNGEKAFMTKYQNSCINLQNDYNYAFAGKGWTNRTFKPTKNLVIRKSNYMFYYSEITGSLIDILNNLGITMTIDSTMPTYGNQNMFQEAKFTEIPRLIFPTSCTSLPYLFYNCVSLKKIEALGVHKTMTYSNTFAGCSKLANIVIEGVIGNNISFSACPLSKESILSVVEHLSDSETGRTVTFKKTARELAFTDDEWASLIATKPNWTFSLI